MHTNLVKIFLVLYYVMTKSRVIACKSFQNTSSTVGMIKSRAFAYKSCQNISTSVEMTKSRAFAYKSCQNISTSVGMTKSGALLTNVVKIFLLLQE